MLFENRLNWKLPKKLMYFTNLRLIGNTGPRPASPHETRITGCNCTSLHQKYKVCSRLPGSLKSWRRKQHPPTMTNERTSPAEVLTLYGLTLMICGSLSFYAADMQSRAISSIYMGNGSGLLCFCLAAGVRNTHLAKGQPGYKMMMACIHFALLFPLVMAGAVSWRLLLAWSVPEKAYVRPYFMAIIASSLLCFAILYTFKPKKGAKAVGEMDDTVSVVSDTTEVTREVKPEAQQTNEEPSLTADATAARRRVSNASNPSGSTNVVRKRARRAAAM